MQKYKRWTTTSKIVEKKGILQGEKLALFSLTALLEQRWNLYSRHKRDTSMLIMNTKLHHNSQNNLAMNKRFLPPLD